MGSDIPSKPPSPDLPTYLLEPLERQSPDALEQVAEYAADLASWKRKKLESDFEEKRRKEEIEDEEARDLEEREISTDPEEYEGVPTSGAYITIKETKPGYHYYYWQWRSGDSWENKYIAPVDPKRK